MSGAQASRARPSLAAVQDAIVAEMAGLGDTLEKYEYLVGRGRALGPPDPSLRRDENLVPGCQSRVWIRSELRDDLLHIRADGEALITRGLVSLLLRVLDRRTPAEILEADLFFLDRTGLGSHLSPARANGLAAVVRHIRRHAENAVAPAHPHPDTLKTDA